MKTNNDWQEILNLHSIHWVHCFNGREEHPDNCIKHDGFYIHKDDIEEHCGELIGMDSGELTTLKTELYAKASAL